MSGLCLGVAFSIVIASVPVQSFTLAWTHSIEKIRWEEDYRIEGKRLIPVMSRVRGSGAGMEPPEGAVLREGVYEYRPHDMKLSSLALMRSADVSDYELCWSGRCNGLSGLLGPPSGGTVDLFPCPDSERR